MGQVFYRCPEQHLWVNMQELGSLLQVQEFKSVTAELSRCAGAMAQPTDGVCRRTLMGRTPNATTTWGVPGCLLVFWGLSASSCLGC
jgi:hypothetical protein